MEYETIEEKQQQNAAEEAQAIDSTAGATATPTNNYPAGWTAATKSLWNGAIFTGILILLCIVLLFLFPKGGLSLESRNLGVGSLLVFFLIFTFTALGSINTYQKGLTQFGTLFGQEGLRSLDIIRWGFMLAMVGVLFHLFIFYLPLLDPETKRQTATLLLGNSVVFAGAILNIVGFLLLATAKGMPDSSRKGCLLMLVPIVLLTLAAFLAPSAVALGTWARTLEAVLIAGGSTLFLIAWHKIISIKS